MLLSKANKAKVKSDSEPLLTCWSDAARNLWSPVISGAVPHVCGRASAISASSPGARPPAEWFSAQLQFHVPSLVSLVFHQTSHLLEKISHSIKVPADIWEMKQAGGTKAGKEKRKKKIYIQQSRGGECELNESSTTTNALPLLISTANQTIARGKVRALLQPLKSSPTIPLSLHAPWKHPNSGRAGCGTDGWVISFRDGIILFFFFKKKERKKKPRTPMKRWWEVRITGATACYGEYPPLTEREWGREPEVEREQERGEEKREREGGAGCRRGSLARKSRVGGRRRRVQERERGGEGARYVGNMLSLPPSLHSNPCAIYFHATGACATLETHDTVTDRPSGGWGRVGGGVLMRTHAEDKSAAKKAANNVNSLKRGASAALLAGWREGQCRLPPQFAERSH